MVAGEAENVIVGAAGAAAGDGSVRAAGGGGGTGDFFAQAPIVSDSPVSSSDMRTTVRTDLLINCSSSFEYVDPGRECFIAS
jgi:hypothetical protein